MKYPNCLKFLVCRAVKIIISYRFEPVGGDVGLLADQRIVLVGDWSLRKKTEQETRKRAEERFDKMRNYRQNVGVIAPIPKGCD